MINGPRTKPTIPIVRIPPMIPMNMISGWILTLRPTSTGRTEISGSAETTRYPRKNRMSTPYMSPLARAYAPIMINATDDPRMGMSSQNAARND
jgi:hypothetical protein